MLPPLTFLLDCLQQPLPILCLPSVLDYKHHCHRPTCPWVMETVAQRVWRASGWGRLIYGCVVSPFVPYLGGFAIIQVPKFDMAVSSCNEVAAVLREWNGSHFAWDFIGCHNNVFLERKMFKQIKTPATLRGYVSLWRKYVFVLCF